ncbi:MAG: hypothetical protein K2X47_15470, partial [Bdellovibrionales bacterium]|nr:hypothetical protein [Bdellovibrionales bacterium]
PVPHIVLNDTEERWITFADGQKIYHGREVSFLLGHLLFQSGGYRVFQGASVQGVGPGSSQPLESRIAESILTASANSKVSLLSSSSSAISLPDLIITPRVETLLFSQGQKGNRIVFGFSPDRLNPFNAGKDGGLDNEFVLSEQGAANAAAMSPQSDVCSAIDFFSSRIQASGYGPWRSDFGVNMDEGVDFRILGYGFGFRNKVYHVKSVIAFELYSPQTGFRTTLREEVVAAGRDFMIALAYNGFSVALEMHRRKTLRNALKEILPQAVGRMIQALPAQLQQARDWAQIGTRALASTSSFGKVLSNTSKMQIQTTTSPETLAENAQCSKRKKGWIESTLESLFTLYALWRYDNVFDQGDDSESMASSAAKASSIGTMVAVVGSGVSPQEKALRGSISNTGFDFVSWDARPSDEVGMGTAAALRLRQESRSAMQIVPIKVIGAFNQIHSGELYAAFEHLAKRADIKLVVVPFKPSVQSLAFTRGIELVAASGKTVIIPAGVGLTHVHGVIEAPAAGKGYRVRGLSSKVQLASDGVGVVEEAVRWMDQVR